MKALLTTGRPKRFAHQKPVMKIHLLFNRIPGEVKTSSFVGCSREAQGPLPVFREKKGQKRARKTYKALYTPFSENCRTPLLGSCKYFH